MWFFGKCKNIFIRKWFLPYTQKQTQKDVTFIKWLNQIPTNIVCVVYITEDHNLQGIQLVCLPCQVWIYHQQHLQNLLHRQVSNELKSDKKVQKKMWFIHSNLDTTNKSLYEFTNFVWFHGNFFAILKFCVISRKFLFYSLRYFLSFFSPLYRHRIRWVITYDVKYAIFESTKTLQKT